MYMFFQHTFQDAIHCQIVIHHEPTIIALQCKTKTKPIKKCPYKAKAERTTQRPNCNELQFLVLFLHVKITTKKTNYSAENDAKIKLIELVRDTGKTFANGSYSFFRIKVKRNISFCRKEIQQIQRSLPLFASFIGKYNCP